MQFNKIPYSPEHVARNHRFEDRVNTAVRTFDNVMGRLGLGGRKGYYNDDAYEFEGGARDELRKKHYDKSLRLLWKAEENASWSSFDDCTKEEQLLISMAEKGLTRGEKAQRKRINSAEFREFLNKTYTTKQKQAIVNVLSMIGHGEAYAWMVSCELLNEVRSTGGRAAVTMQVLEEAKHLLKELQARGQLGWLAGAEATAETGAPTVLQPRGRAPAIGRSSSTAVTAESTSRKPSGRLPKSTPCRKRSSCSGSRTATRISKSEATRTRRQSPSRAIHSCRQPISRTTVARLRAVSGVSGKGAWSTSKAGAAQRRMAAATKARPLARSQARVPAPKGWLMPSPTGAASRCCRQ